MNLDFLRWVRSGFPNPMIVNIIGPIASGKTFFLKTVAEVINADSVGALSLDRSVFEEQYQILIRYLKGDLDEDEMVEWRDEIDELEDNFSRTPTDIRRYFDITIQKDILKARVFPSGRYGSTLYLDSLDLVTIEGSDDFRLYRFVAAGAHEEAEKITKEDSLMYCVSLDQLHYLGRLLANNGHVDFSETESNMMYMDEPPHRIALSILSSLTYLSQRIDKVPCSGMISHWGEIYVLTPFIIGGFGLEEDTDKLIEFVESTDLHTLSPEEVIDSWIRYAEPFCEQFLDFVRSDRYSSESHPELDGYEPPDDIGVLVGNLRRIKNWCPRENYIPYPENKDVYSELEIRERKDVLLCVREMIEYSRGERGTDLRFVSYHPEGNPFGDSELTVPYEWFE